jgi:hypothetical protein
VKAAVKAAVMAADGNKKAGARPAFGVGDIRLREEIGAFRAQYLQSSILAEFNIWQ